MKPLDARTLKVSRPLRLLLIVTLGLIVFAYFRGKTDDEAPAPVSMPTPAHHAPTPASSPDAHANAGAPDTVATTEPSPVDLFPSQTWQPPPLPFTVRSLWLDQHGVFYVVIAGTGREFALCANCAKKGFLRSGDVILNAYRIERIDRREIRFVYLPLKRQQTLTLGELK